MYDFFINHMKKFLDFLKFSLTSPFVLYRYKYLYLDKNSNFLEYIEKIAMQVAEKEDLFVRFVKFDDLNKDELDENQKAVGIFKYLEKDNQELMNQYFSILDEFKNKKLEISDNLKYPRIELTEKYNVFVMIHELGHYFIYKNDQIQSEDGANAYIEEFFKNNLPDFFSWIFQIDIRVRTNKELKFSEYQSYLYYKEYKSWIKNYKELK